jgi:hypothetical protein
MQAGILKYSLGCEVYSEGSYMARKPDRTAQAIGAGVTAFVGVLLGGLPGALIGAAIGHWASGEASKFGA